MLLSLTDVCELSGVFVLTLLLMLSLFLFWIKPLNVKLTAPCVQSYPIVGFLGYAARNWNEWPSVTANLCHKYNRTWGGPVPKFGGLPGAYFYVHQEETFKHILSDVDTYIKGDVWKGIFGELLGSGIFASDGEVWKMHRKLMSNMFSRNLLRHNADVTRMKLFEVVHQLKEKIKVQNGSIDVDVQDIFFRLTFDITTLITFGIDFGSVIGESQHDFPLAFDEISSLCQKRFLDPFYKMKRFLNIGSRERRIRELKKVIDKYACEIISERKINHDPASKDILSRYIDYSETSCSSMSSDTLRDVVMNIMLAGRDTTACALSWTWYELSRNSNVVNKVVEEIQDVCGTPERADYSYDNMNRLRYTHGVILEVLRLHPPVCQDPRFATKHSILPDGTEIPCGAGIDMCFYASGRSKAIWGDDAQRFNPERFLNEKEPNPFRYPMFNAGPRMCLGRPLALMNIKLALSVLLPLFIFQDKKRHSGEYKWTLVQSMKDGFELNVSNRRSFVV